MALTRDEAIRLAYRSLFSEGWQAAHERASVALDFPWETAEKRQRVVEFNFVNKHIRLDPRRHTDKTSLRKAFAEAARDHVTAAVADFRLNLSGLDASTWTAIRRKYHVRGIPKAEGKPPARSQNANAKNLELLSFVSERIIPFWQLLKPRLDKYDRDVRLLPGHRGPNVAVPRQYLAEEWNRTHPWWPMSSGDVLMGQFHRAATRPHIARELLSQLQREVQEELQGIQEDARKVATFPEPSEKEVQAGRRAWRQSPEGKESRRRIDQLTQRAREQQESIGPDDWNAWMKQEGQRVHDSLTRRELVGRVAWHVALAMAGRREEEQRQAFMRPLRYWFLDEAYGRVPEPDGDGYLPIPAEVWGERMREGIRKRLAARRILGSSSAQQHVPQASSHTKRPAPAKKRTPGPARPPR